MHEFLPLGSRNYSKHTDQEAFRRELQAPDRIAPLMADRCRTGGADVRWIKSPEGRPQILDAERRVEWVTDEPNRVSVTLVVLVGDDGRVQRGYRASATTEGARQIEGYVSHWATCTRPPARRLR